MQLKTNDKTIKTIVVLGAPRSGTSMTAGILSRMGVDFGNIRQPDAENPRGYYEDRDFLKLMLKIFRSVDAASNGFNPPEPAAIRLQKNSFEDQIKSLVHRRVSNAQSNLWGWKATTTSFTLDLFLDHLINPHFVIVLRHPLGRADSIVKYTRNKSIYQALDQLQALELANRYYHEIYRFLVKHRKLPCVFVSFEETVAAPINTINRLMKFLQASLNEETVDAIQEFVIPRSEMKKMKARMLETETKSPPAAKKVNNFGEKILERLRW